MSRRWFLVDAEGNLLYPTPVRKLKSKKKTKQTPMGPSIRELSKLEDAIFANSERRRIFLSIVSEYQKKTLPLGSRVRVAVLRHCWVALKWRATLDGKVIVLK